MSEFILNTIPEAIDAIRNGELVIVVLMMRIVKTKVISLLLPKK